MEAAFKRVGTHTAASDVLNEEEPRGVKAPVSQGSMKRHAVSERDGNSIGGGIASHGGNEFEVFRRRVGVPEALRTGEPDSNDQMFFLAANYREFDFVALRLSKLRRSSSGCNPGWRIIEGWFCLSPHGLRVQWEMCKLDDMRTSGLRDMRKVYDIVMPLPVGLDTGWSEHTDARKDRDARKDSAVDPPLRRVAESRLSGLIKDHKRVTEKPQIIPFSYIYCAWIVSI
ncbi:hypothetical protein B0H10DRAFT_1958852 [Mycena sp. CBHHK59/15]|nr:hypothetical protein B0H10DRAFT_1958852 [Mycena sp. CBHHK59/15]